MLTLETFKIAVAVLIAIFAIVRMRTTKAQETNTSNQPTTKPTTKPKIPAGTFHA